MIVPETILGLMLLQEIGFDIVSMLTTRQMAYLAGGVVIIVGLCSLFFVTRKRGRSR